MSEIAPPVAALIEELSKLPNVGPKTAQRLAFFILRSPTDLARRLAEAIMRVKESIIYCSRCFNFTESDPCTICSDSKRDQSSIMAVEEPLDVMALEKVGAYKGLFHVLHGALSPMDGIGRKDLRIDELLSRLEGGTVRELILATNPNLKGEYTARYIENEIKNTLNLPGLRMTTLARGLPTGGALDYADEGTLRRAIEGRHTL